MVSQENSHKLATQRALLEHLHILPFQTSTINYSNTSGTLYEQSLDGHKSNYMLKFARFISSRQNQCFTIENWKPKNSKRTE